MRITFLVFVLRINAPLKETKSNTVAVP